MCVAAGVPATAAGGLEATATTAGHAEHTGNRRTCCLPVCVVLHLFVLPFILGLPLAVDGMFKSKN